MAGMTSRPATTLTPLPISGILPCQAIAAMVARGDISTTRPLDDDQIQPASLDLRLGARAYRVRASFLPGRRLAVSQRLEEVVLHAFDISEGAVLETGCVYIVPLMESLALPSAIAASTNPKSSTGRLDIFTRVISDHAVLFDKIAAGYHGPLYAEISPSTFPILVRAGSRLSQIRFRIGDPRVRDGDLAALHQAERLVDSEEALLASSVAVSIDLSGRGKERLIGYRAKKHAGLVDVDRRAALDIDDFWEPLYARGSGSLVLDPSEFYILASKEAVHVPPDHAAEMVAFDPLVGEFRVHYAGFFDPGFGHAAAGGAGARAVLEVRSHEIPFIVEDGQIVGRLVYERMSERPARLYGEGEGSNYQGQGLKLSKHFRQPPDHT
ncbi:MAG: 2-deoxycytidine 5-triphosphate deaminase [Candidatus Raskinella chloraquaticus]|uniref:2-deoxycytidine 5-triphosphate deaminase n=2 Tax=Candidatus Raskinella chloraquaticus TaxID=1951219 RepID=A0A1W9I2H5_9HYPH|nr:MAG: 2-deoxycytidine 5-triphosphate deaminase [Proteobacteria bacterium SG_bin8]